MMHHAQAEPPRGMSPKDAPVAGDQQQSRGGERGKQTEDAEIPDFAGIYACDARGTLRQHKRKQHAERSDRAVRRDHKRSDMEENGVHLGQDTGWDPREKGMWQGTREVEADPLDRG